MRAIATLIAAGIALAALGGCQSGGEDGEADTEQEDGEGDDED
jgi:hypothetical protein